MEFKGICEEEGCAEAVTMTEEELKATGGKYLCSDHYEEVEEEATGPKPKNEMKVEKADESEDDEESEDEDSEEDEDESEDEETDEDEDNPRVFSCPGCGSQKVKYEDSTFYVRATAMGTRTITYDDGGDEYDSDNDYDENDLTHEELDDNYDPDLGKGKCAECDRAYDFDEWNSKGKRRQNDE